MISLRISRSVNTLPAIQPGLNACGGGQRSTVLPYDSGEQDRFKEAAPAGPAASRDHADLFHRQQEGAWPSRPSPLGGRRWGEFAVTQVQLRDEDAESLWRMARPANSERTAA